MNTALEDRHFQCGRDVVTTLQFIRHLEKEMMDNKISIDDNDDRRTTANTSAPTIICCNP